MLVKCLFILPQKRVRESPHSQRHFYQQQQHSMSAVAYKNLHDPHQAHTCFHYPSSPMHAFFISLIHCAFPLRD